MLVLTRYVGQEIRIGDDIVVTVLQVKGQQVQIGVTAPIVIPVHRQEIYERIEREGREIARQRKARKLAAATPPKTGKDDPTP